MQITNHRAIGLATSKSQNNSEKTKPNRVQHDPTVFSDHNALYLVPGTMTDVDAVDVIEEESNLPRQDFKKKNFEILQRMQEKKLQEQEMIEQERLKMIRKQEKLKQLILKQAAEVREQKQRAKDEEDRQRAEEDA
jgi:DNA repair exonuclease SbcCD nuclease subunit